MPLSDDEFRKLWLELGNPNSWHWKTASGLFVKKTESVEAVHIVDILDSLDKEKTFEAKEQTNEIRNYLAGLQTLFSSQKHTEAADAIKILLAEHPSKGYDISDIPIEYYTEMSSENIIFLDAVEYALNHGGVLQSAREAVTYRLHAGKNDLNYYYFTRTVAIYFKEGSDYFVAFDDDPFENILISNAQQGYELDALWYISLNNQSIANAIKRARSVGRIVPITDNNEQKDPSIISKYIIGDKAKDYDSFISQHLKKNLCVWTLANDNCKFIPTGKALIRVVGLGGGVFVNNVVDASILCSFHGRSRGSVTAQNLPVEAEVS